MKLCDLHAHSYYSDGACSTKELLEQAKLAGLLAVALTDHNTVDGIEVFLNESKKLNIEGIAGVEISCEYNEKELHVIALFVENSIDKIKEFLKVLNVRKEESNINLAKALNENGYKIDYAKMRKQAVGSINRVLFATELMKSGYIKSVKEGLDTILSAKHGFYVPPKRLDVNEVLSFIKSINAVSVLAHPLLNLTREELTDFLALAKTEGLNAIETEYSKYSLESREFSKELCVKFGLFESGGSDFHGENKPDIQIGIGKGDLQVPYEFLEKLKNLR